jgi:hypothetical protein
MAEGCTLTYLPASSLQGGSRTVVLTTVEARWAAAQFVGPNSDSFHNSAVDRTLFPWHFPTLHYVFQREASRPTAGRISSGARIEHLVGILRM